MNKPWTIIVTWVPFSQGATVHHPCESQGPFSELTRGNFASANDAAAWALGNLGTNYRSWWIVYRPIEEEPLG